MSVRWTKEQQAVIDTRGKSLLVSAAAGSGKTAVLVERIIQMISSTDAPIDIDQLLVVTFTKAAASEMRERVMAAIETQLEADPDNEHLQKQKLLLPSSMITTIDSFCMNVLREHFAEINLDPGFRIGDPQEMTLLKQDIAERVLEQCYETHEQKFIDFVTIYANGKLDYGISDLILRIYNFSQSHPWPQQWLDHALDYNLLSLPEAGKVHPLLHLAAEETANWLKEAHTILESAHEAAENAGAVGYAQTLVSDLEMIDQVMACGDYMAYAKAFPVKWKTLSSKGCKEVAESDKKVVKDLRDKAKKMVSELEKSYYFKDLETILNNEQAIVSIFGQVIELTKAFDRAYADEKKKRNIIDFNDLEHFALKVFTNEKGEKTDTARAYAKQYVEIMCDEYQDSNEVQETLFRSISREDDGQPNMFMVGDVKQSIYRFRMAKPEIFLGKYQMYDGSKEGYQRIDLHQNFRSRACVLESINQIFEKLMEVSVSGMAYTEDVALHPGAVFEETELNIAKESEWMVIEKDPSGQLSKEEIEARAIGMKIKALTDPNTGLNIYDGERKCYRKAVYGDIVILLRTMKGWSEPFVHVLKEMGISAIGDTSTGFFDTIEVQGILNMLRILDNPLQDIPMAAVMTSVIGHFTEADLVTLQTKYKGGSLYTKLKQSSHDNEAHALKEKTDAFMDLYKLLRKMKIHLTIEDLIYRIFELTGYMQYMYSMPGGEVRRANLNRLLSYASEFEQTSYHGVFHFIRYIDQLKEAKEDLGEMIVNEDAENTVRIMSIHKSKGLEFPICIVAGLAKQMNFSDLRARVLIDEKYGIAADGMELEKRIRIKSFSKKVIAKKQLVDTLSEEIRVLYVALTRAKEKLILTATVDSLEKAEDKWLSACDRNGCLLYSELIGAKTYLDWIGPILWSDGNRGLTMGFEYCPETYGSQEKKEIDLLAEAFEDQILLEDYQQLSDEKRSETEQIKALKNWEYPYDVLTKIHSKMTVSELKKLSLEEQSETATFKWNKKKRHKHVSQAEGQKKGNATHKLLELIPFDRVSSIEDLEHWTQIFVDRGRIPKEWADVIPMTQVFEFCRSSIGQRMADALLQGRLSREKQFVMGVPVTRVYPEMTSDAQILIQGIIDVFFEEEDGVVLLDYKTDQIPEHKDTETLLKQRYSAQLDYYQLAIEQITGKKVKEKIIYSISENQVVYLN